MKKFLYQLQSVTLPATFGGCTGYLTGGLIETLPLVPYIVTLGVYLYFLIRVTTFIGDFYEDLYTYESYCDYMREQYPAKRILPESEFLLHYNAIQQEKSSQGDK